MQWKRAKKIPEQIAKVIAEAKSRAGVKNIAKTIDSDILITGARIIDPDSTEGIKFAKMYYDEIRSFSTDAKKIAKILGKKNQISRRLKHIFLKISLCMIQTQKAIGDLIQIVLSLKAGNVL